MLQANELRIGNWVEWDGKYVKVETIDKDGVTTDAKPRYHGDWEVFRYADDINPIPLTPDILDTLFQYDRNEGWNLGGAFEIDNDLNLSFRHWEGDADRGGTEGHPIIKVKSVHQLQNICYSIFGTELNINL
jgi:hypothetical protein